MSIKEQKDIEEILGTQLKSIKIMNNTIKAMIESQRLLDLRLEKLEKDSTTGQGWVKWLANQIGV